MSDLLPEYWFDSYLWNIDGVGVWPIWLSCLSLSCVSLYRGFLIPEKRRRYGIYIVVLIFISLLIPFTGRYTDELKFRQACAKDAGFSIYKEVTLAPGMIIPIDPEKGAVGSEGHLIFKDLGFEIDQDKFSKMFDYSSYIMKGNPKMFRVYIRIKATGDLVSQLINYHGYPGFLSGGSRRCEDIFRNLKIPISDGMLRNITSTFNLGKDA